MYVNFFLKIILVLFFMQSTWAIAAQYCQHEKKPHEHHFGHHIHKHSYQQNDDSSVSHQSLGDSSVFSIDTDCPYCQIASIKSMIATLLVFDGNFKHFLILEHYDNFPEIIPHKPERPNWTLAV